MITFFWSFVTAFGFAASGFLLREGEFKIAGILFVATWVWLTFPKMPMWLIRQMGKLFNGHRKAAA
jgi:hypothetical protein